MAVALQRKRKRVDLRDLNSKIDDQRPTQSCFFVGHHDYILSVSNNPVDYLIEYVNCCLTDTAGFIRDEALELTNSACHPAILTHMVCSILSYNKVPLKNIHQCLVRGTLIMAEAAILVSRADQSIALYISESMLRSYVCNDSAVTLNFDAKFEQSDISSTAVDDILKHVPLGVPKPTNKCLAPSSARYAKMSAVDLLLSNEEQCQDFDNEYCDPATYKDRALKSKRSKNMYALFVLADHAATHFLENGPDNSEIRSYITHSGFGTKNISTLHSAIQVIGTMGGANEHEISTVPTLFFNSLMDQDLSFQGGQIML